MLHLLLFCCFTCCYFSDAADVDLQFYMFQTYFVGGFSLQVVGCVGSA